MLALSQLCGIRRDKFFSCVIKGAMVTLTAGWTEACWTVDTKLMFTSVNSCGALTSAASCVEARQSIVYFS